MKKFFALCALLLLTAGAARAQFGVVGGYTYSGMSGYHAGVAYKLDLPFVTIQPQLTYEAKGENLDAAVTSFKNTSGFLELGVGLQGGVDLLAFRPYFLLQPFVGYDVNPRNAAAGLSGDALKDARNRLEYGFGVGAGIELIDHIQLSVQYFMNLGPLYDEDKLLVAGWPDAVRNYRGVKVSLSLFL